MYFLNFFRPNGAPTNDNYTIGGLAHLLWFLIPALVIIGLLIILRYKKRDGRIVLLVLASLMLLLRIIKYLIFKPFIWDESWKNIVPFEMCTILSFTVPFTVYFKTKKLNPYLYALAVLGGVVTIAYSEWIFNGLGLDFNKLESLLVHWILIAIPFISVATKRFAFNFKEIYKPVVALLILIAYATLANEVITPGSNHMFLRNNPLSFAIPGLHHLFTLGVITIVLMLLLYLPFNLKRKKTI